MKVKGNGYLDFINNYLEPLFMDIISQSENRITEYNKKVINDLAKSGVRRSIKYKPISQFKCKKCDNVFGNSRQLKAHKNALHTRVSAIPKSQLSMIRWLL